MRSRWIPAALLACCVGCGDQILGIPRQTLVEDLADEDAIDLCQEFFAYICADSRGEDYCDACILYEVCAATQLVSTMDVLCDDVAVGLVRDCAQERTEEVCAMGGGCMFDVAEELCPPPEFLLLQ
jgi:hypothetical protein